MHAEHSLQFRNFVPPMIECLEDADGQVREAAKTNIIELFG
jgi:CLIP-associating protein 1/2